MRCGVGLLGRGHPASARQLCVLFRHRSDARMFLLPSAMATVTSRAPTPWSITGARTRQWRSRPGDDSATDIWSARATAR